MKRFELDVTGCDLPRWHLPRIIPLRVGTHGADFDVDDAEINQMARTSMGDPETTIGFFSHHLPVGGIIRRSIP